MRKILAIDDKHDNLITIKAVIKMLLPDYEVLMAQSGEQGIQLAKEHQPEVILLDIIMPGMDGYDVCKKLKQDSITQNIPIVIITALKTDSESKVKALGLGADAFVAKPFEPVELVAQLKVVLRTKLAEDKLREEKEQLDLLVKERTRVIEESERKYRLLVESTQEPIIVIQHGIIQFANPIASEISEYEVSELLGTPFSKYLHPNDTKHVFESYKKRVNKETGINDFELRILCKSGKTLWFSFKVNQIDWQNEFALLYILHNTTEQKEIEKQKRKNALRSEILLEIHKKAFELDDSELYQFVLEKTVAITESEIGFFHQFDDDNNTIKLTAWNTNTVENCKTQQETHYPIEYAGNWVDCVKEGKPVVYNEFKKSPNQKGVPEGHVQLERFMSIPVMNGDKVYYVFCIGNKAEDYTESDENNIQIIANEITQILEKRRFELAIKQSTEKYEAIYNNAPLPFHSLDPNGHIVDVNPAWLKVTGYSQTEVLEKWYGDFLHERSVDIFKRNFPKLKDLGRVQNVPFKLRTKDGDYIDIKLDGSSSYSTEGDFLQTYCTFKNVTEEVEQQNKLEESEAKYRSFAQHFDGIAFKGFYDYSVDFINGKINEITGYDEDDFILGRVKMNELIYPEDRKRVAKKAAKFVNSEKVSTSRTYRILTKKNEVKWITESITKFEDRQGQGVYGIIQDITQTKKTNLLLKELNRFNQTLLDTIPFSMEIVSLTGEILFLNPVLESLVGKDKVGQQCWSLYRDDKKQCSKCPLKSKIRMGEVNQLETSGVFGGRTFDIVHKSMLFNGEKALMEIFIETTERKKFENEIIKAKEKAQESDRLKSAFLANMSHEIRTPMNGILGFTELLKEPGLTGEDQSRYIDIITRSGDRMLNTVNDIIEISKIETGQIIISKQKMNVRRHLQTLYQFFELEAKNKGLQLSLDSQIKDEESEIITDKSKLSSILTNLIKNALKFTEQGFLKIGGQRKDDNIEFYIQDSGIGIPGNRLEAIFNRFEQADIDDEKVFEGSGLGLAISKSYVEMLGGKIWVESTVNSGTTFYFTIPYLSANKKPTANNTASPKEKIGTNKELNILVAEDDEISRLHLSILLKKITTKVRFVENGKDAVEMCKSNPDFNLILMDIKLPVMDGLEATRKIRKFNTEILIIAQTAFALQGDKEKALAAGCNDYLSKPINVNRLKELLKSDSDNF